MYTDLLCRTYRAVKDVQPNAVIVGGAVAGVDISFISKMLDAGAENCMDMISVHTYVHAPRRYSVPYDAPAPVAVNKFVEAITAVENLVRQKTGRTMRVVVSEAGRSDLGQSSNEQLTADYITELYRRAPSIPFLEGIWLFCLEDNRHGFGLVRNNNAKKPGFAAYQAAAKK